MSNLPELRAIAKNMNVRGYSVMKKGDLIAAIEQHKGMAQLKAQVQVKEPVKEQVRTDAPVEVKEQVQQEAPVKEKKERKANGWNDYLADYRAKNNVSLRQAMAAAKVEYAELKSKKKDASPDASGVAA